MDILIKLTVPNYVYRFYRDASQHIAGSSAETVMADALCAYAGLLNEEVARQRNQANPEDGEAEGQANSCRGNGSERSRS